MSKQLYISLLRKGSTGSELLNILDSFVSDDNEQPTEALKLEPVQF